MSCVVIRSHYTGEIIPPSQHKLAIGISACLAGHEVRYDGQHKSRPLIVNRLTNYAELLPFCPEVAAGLGVPRPPVKLIATSQGIRAQGSMDRRLDVTVALNRAAELICEELYCEDVNARKLSGFIFKSRSPSCGLGSTPLHTERDEQVISYGNGLFAEQLRISAPWLPCVEEEWLTSEDHCRRFLAACAVTAFTRYRQSGYADLTRQLEKDMHVAGDLLIGALLRTDQAPEKEAALNEQLKSYWSDR